MRCTDLGPPEQAQALLAITCCSIEIGHQVQSRFSRSIYLPCRSEHSLICLMTFEILSGHACALRATPCNLSCQLYIWSVIQRINAVLEFNIFPSWMCVTCDDSKSIISACQLSHHAVRMC